MFLSMTFWFHRQVHTKIVTSVAILRLRWAQNWAKLQELEQQANDDMFVIVSDVHLDRPQVLEKLRKMFEGFSGLPHLPLFVLIGDFTSRPVSFGSFSHLDYCKLDPETHNIFLSEIRRSFRQRRCSTITWAFPKFS